jgi:hypothetical protein
MPDEPVTIPEIRSSTTFSSGWHELHIEFMQLSNEEQALTQGVRRLIAYVVSGIEDGRDVGRWTIAQSPTESFQERFEVLASRGGAALGQMPRDARLLDYWLHRLHQNLSENNSKWLRRVITDHPKKGTNKITVENATIESVCEASAVFCLRLEKQALEAVNLPRKGPEACYSEWITYNFVSISVPSGHTHRKIIERVARGAQEPIPIEFLSHRLDHRVPSRGSGIFGAPGTFLDDLAGTYELRWWISEKGLRMAQDPPEGIPYVDASGVGPKKGKQRVAPAGARTPAAASDTLQPRAEGKKPPLQKYKSPVKRAIAHALVKNPNVSDLELCRSIDDEGTAELDGKDRTFEAAYKDPKRRPKVETAISKVRRNMRDAGLL